MKMDCLSENQSRRHVHQWKCRSWSLFTPVHVALVTILMASCVACGAAELASWYGEKHRGLLMANGQRFDPDKCTAASWFYDLGTKVVVTHEDRTVIVEITDRGPAKSLLKKGRIIDLSRAAFAKLADLDLGIIDVTVRRQ